MPFLQHKHSGHLELTKVKIKSHDGGDNQSPPSWLLQLYETPTLRFAKVTAMLTLSSQGFPGETTPTTYHYD